MTLPKASSKRRYLSLAVSAAVESITIDNAIDNGDPKFDPAFQSIQTAVDDEIQPPTADWGGMVRENAGAITFGILTPLWPAGAIAFLTVGVNLVVDWFLHLASGLKD